MLVTHAQRPKGRKLLPLAVKLCHKFATFQWGCWLGSLCSLCLVAQAMGWDAADCLPSACSMQDLLEYVSCLSGAQNVKKPAKPLTGCLVIKNFLHSQKFYIFSSWVTSCGKRRWKPLETSGLTRRESVRCPECFYRVLAMAMWWRWFIAAWNPSPAHLTIPRNPFHVD